jgi:Fibronectin type III domain.
MKSLKKYFSFIIVFALAIMMLPAISSAATVGDVLTMPEDGWQRYDDTDSRIEYIGSWMPEKTTGNYQLTGNKTVDDSSKYCFEFYGSKLRLIVAKGSSHSTSVAVKIDGITYSYNENSSQTLRCVLGFEKTDLNLGIHTVEIYNQSTYNYKQVFIDAIDINKNGYLIPVATNLKANSGNKKVDLSWDSIEGTTSYTIKRATTSGGPYTPIATVSGSAITYTDSGLDNGTTYFYVITAKQNGKDSPNSNEAAATPQGDYVGNKAILEVVMTNGTIKEYDLTMDEIDQYLKWYDDRSSGIGKSYFRIIKRSNVKPFNNRYEYLQFDKIYSFEVKDYNDK